MKIHLLPLLLLTGCNLPVGEPEKVTAELSWSVTDFTSGHAGCPADFPKVVVVAQIGNEPINGSFRQTFDCAAGHGALSLYKTGTVKTQDADGQPLILQPTGQYQVTANLTGAQAETIKAMSLTRFIDVENGKTTADLPISIDGNYASFQWDLVNGASEHPGCGSLGVDQIEVQYQWADMPGQPVRTSRFPCQQQDEVWGDPTKTGSGVSEPIEVGSFNATARALSASGTELARKEFTFSEYPAANSFEYEVGNVPFTLTVAH